MPDLSQSITHPSNSSVSEEAWCQTAHETSNLQGTHVGTACKQRSWCQHPWPVRLSENQWDAMDNYNVYPWEQSGLSPAWGRAVPSQWQLSSPQTPPSSPGTAPTGTERGGTHSGCSHCCLVSASRDRETRSQTSIMMTYSIQPAHYRM